MFQTAGLVACVDGKRALDLAVKVSRYVKKRGLTVFLEPALPQHVKKLDVSISLERLETSLIIPVGGDFIVDLKGGCYFLGGEGAEV